MPATTFDDLVQRYGAEIYRAARFYTADAQLAEDVTQEVFIAALREIDRLRDPRSWLARVTRNKALNAVRTRLRRHEVEIADAVAAEDDPQRLYEDAEVVRAIERLPAKLREVLVLRYYDGFAPDEIARMSHWTPGAVRVRLHRAREALRALLEGDDHK